MLLANSGDPDQTPHHAASDLGLHCLPMYPFLGFPDNNGLKILINRSSKGTCFYIEEDNVEHFILVLNDLNSFMP